MAIADKNYLIQCFIEDVKHIDGLQSKRDDFLSKYNNWSKEFEKALRSLRNLKKQIPSVANFSQTQYFWVSYFVMFCIIHSIREKNYVIGISGIILWFLFVIIVMRNATMFASTFSKINSYLDFNIRLNYSLAHIDKKLLDINKKFASNNRNSLRIIPDCTEEDSFLPQGDSLFLILTRCCGFWIDFVRLASTMLLSILLFKLNTKPFLYFFNLVWVFLTIMLLCQYLKLIRCSIHIKYCKNLLEGMKDVIFRWNRYNCCEFKSVIGEGHNSVAFLKLIQWNSDVDSIILNPSLAYTAIVVHVACRLQQYLYSRNIEKILELLFFPNSDAN